VADPTTDERLLEWHSDQKNGRLTDAQIYYRAYELMKDFKTERDEARARVRELQGLQDEAEAWLENQRFGKGRGS